LARGLSPMEYGWSTNEANSAAALILIIDTLY
jgi:hypothetical protein